MMISGNRRIPLVYSSEKEKEPIYMKYVPSSSRTVRFGCVCPPPPSEPGWRFTLSTSVSGPFLGSSSSDGSVLVFTNLSKVFSSIDSGSTWRETRVLRTWYDIASSGDGSVMIVGVPGENIFRSTDFGISWFSTAAGNRLWTPVACSSDGSTFLAADYNVNNVNNSYIYKSTDSGATWTALTSAGGRLWLSMACSSNGSVIVAAVDNGQIYVSTDSGATWATNSPSKKWYTISCTPDGTKIIAPGYNDYLYISSDSGATWTQQTSAGSRNWYGVGISADGSKLVATVTGNYIYTSTDSGTTWTPQISAGSRNWYDVTLSSDGTKIMALNNSGNVYTGVYA